MFKHLLFVISFMLCSAFALVAEEPPAGVSSVDQFSGQQRVVSLPGHCDVEDSNAAFFNAKKMVIEAWKVKDEGKDVVYMFRAVLVQKNPIFITPGESMVLIVDGERIVLKSDTGSINRRFKVNVFIREEVWYHIDLETLRKICNGKSIKVQLKGLTLAAVGEATTEGLANLKRFGDAYLK